VCLLLKGARVEEELATAEAQWRMTVERWPSRTGTDGVVLRISGVERR
jgi:hypothetical protein